MTVQTVGLASCVELVERHFHRILDELEILREPLAARFNRGPVDSGDVRALIEPPVRAFLAATDVVGAGFVAAQGALSDRTLYLAWWQGDDQRLLAEPDASSSGTPFDYTRHPWFRTPRLTGRPHVTGPYVDFICTDEYVMTTTAPVVSNGRMVGVVGADTLVETLERLWMPTLRAAGATVVSDVGRTVASADPHRPTGTLIHLDDCRELIACDRLPLSVLRP
ncbi:MAG: cache domain-containing protein [Aeromicrobium sp.]